MKKLLSCLLAVMLLGSMATGMATAEGEQQTVRIVWWGSQVRHDKTAAMIAKFEEKNPDIKIEPEFTDWGGYWSKLATQVAGGLTPDIMQMDYMYINQYATNGVLSKLDDYMNSGSLNIADIDPSIIDGGKVADGIYGISAGTNALAMTYVKSVADEAGVTIPMSPTREEYMQMSKQIYDKTGRTDNTVVGCGIDLLRFYLRSMGMQLYSEDGSTLGFDDPKYIVDLWNDSLKAVEDGYGLPVGENTAASDFDTYVNDTWVGFMWTNQLGAFQEGSGVELELCEIPSFTGATTYPTYFKPSMFWSMSETATSKDAAIKLIDFYTNDLDCADIVGNERGMMISSKVREHLLPTMDDASKKVSAMLDYLSESGHTSPIMNADPTAHGEITELLGTYTEQVRYGTVSDLTATAQQFMDEANALLAAPKAE